MSVLMRGGDMPKNCEECNFKGECRNYWEKIREAYTRPSWCPLVEVVDPKIVGKHTGAIIIDELFDKDINVRSKTEPQTEECPFDDKIPCEWVCTEYGKCKYKPKTEPQTEVKVEPTWVGVTYGRFEDEPQSDARKFLGYACETCKHRDEEWDSEACDGCCENDDHYESQTERVETMSCQECKWWFTDSLKHGGYCQSLLYNHECRYEPEVDCSWK